MSFQTVCVLVLASLVVRPTLAEKYETFDNLPSTSDHGWSLYSATADFTANVTSTTRAGGQSGPGELEVDVTPVPFSQSAYFADTHLGGSFNLDTDFSFSGTLKLERLDLVDSMEIVIGFFDSQAARQPFEMGRTPYVGVVIGSGSVGSPLIQSDGWVGVGNAWANGGAAGGYIINFSAQDAVPIMWNFVSEREFGGEGTVTARIGSHRVSSTLVSYGRDYNPTFDAFGVLAWGTNFGTVSDITLILDDLRYSTVIPEPTSPLLTMFGSCIALLGRTRKVTGVVFSQTDSRPREDSHNSPLRLRMADANG